MTFAEWAEVMSIFARYEPKSTYGISAEHDELWIGSTKPSAMSAKDAEFLNAHHFYYSEELGSWNTFV